MGADPPEGWIGQRQDARERFLYRGFLIVNKISHAGKADSPEQNSCFKGADPDHDKGILVSLVTGNEIFDFVVWALSVLKLLLDFFHPLDLRRRATALVV
jgi:hypothetical protein